MSPHHQVFYGLSLVFNSGQVCRSLEGCLWTKTQFHGMPNVCLSPSNFWVSLLQQCSKCPAALTVRETEQITREYHDCLWATSTRSHSTIRRIPHLKSQLNDVSDAVAWLYVMWYATVDTMSHRNASLLRCEEWCTDMSDQILMGQSLLWVVLNFQSVDQLLGFEPVSESEVEVDGLEVMWWWYRYNFNSHCGGGWPRILVFSVQDCQAPTMTVLVCSAAPW